MSTACILSVGYWAILLPATRSHGIWRRIVPTSTLQGDMKASKGHTRRPSLLPTDAINTGNNQQTPGAEQGAEAGLRSLRILDAKVVSYRARTQVRARSERPGSFGGLALTVRPPASSPCGIRQSRFLRSALRPLVTVVLAVLAHYIRLLLALATAATCAYPCAE